MPSHSTGLGLLYPKVSLLLVEVCRLVEWKKEWCSLSREGALVCLNSVLKRAGEFCQQYSHWVGKWAPVGSTTATLEIINRICIFRFVEDGK